MRVALVPGAFDDCSPPVLTPPTTPPDVESLSDDARLDGAKLPGIGSEFPGCWFWPSAVNSPLGAASTIFAAFHF